MRRLIVLICMSFFSVSAVQAELKIGVIDVLTLVQRSPQADEIRNRIRDEFKTREQEIVGLQKELQDEVGNFERDKAVMSETAKIEAEQAIVDKQRNLRRLQEDFREDTTRRQNEEMQGLLEVIGGKLEIIADQENFDIILHRDAVPYVKEKFDITALVLEKLNESNKAKANSK